MTEQGLKDEFKKKFDDKYRHGECEPECCAYNPDYDDMADYWLSKRQAELSSLRGEIEGGKRSVCVDVINCQEVECISNRRFNAGADFSLSCINKLIETK